MNKKDNETSRSSGVSRRSFLHWATAVGAAGTALSGAVVLRSLLQNGGDPRFQLRLGSHEFPLAPLAHPQDLEGFNGDYSKRAHHAFWQNKEEYIQSLGGIPKPTEKTTFVVIGGGIGGLTAAYGLRHSYPLILEQANQLGGNSKGEEWKGLRYSIGAAYINEPPVGSPLYKLLDELKVLDHARVDSAGVGSFVCKKNEVIHHFWEGDSDPDHREEFRRVKQAILKEGEEGYLEIPIRSQEGLNSQQLAILDRQSFTAWMKSHLGRVHPHIEEFIQHYCWSSFGGGPDELSSAQVLNFLTADLSKVVAFPGGNSAISQALAQKLNRELRPRLNALVVDVRLNPSGVLVTYEDTRGRLASIQAKACVISCAKFIAKHFIHEMPQDQQHAISQLKYRAFVVGNLLIEQKIKTPSYDAFCLGEELSKSNEAAAKRRPYTDFVFASWAAHDSADRTALTFYKPFPYDGGRKELYQENAFQKIKSDFETAIPELLAALNIDGKNLKAMRFTRWGHALPLGGIGLLAEGIPQMASRTLGDRIYFAQQDNWACPSFESAATSALSVVEEIRKQYPR